jgi:hypothetical protein
MEIIPQSSPDHPRAVRKKNRQRSRITNGSLLPTVDGRSLWARLMRDTLQNLEAHCGDMSETQRLAARRVSTLEAELIFLEDKFAAARAAGEEPNVAALDLYGRLADRQRRLADSALGWHRTARDVTPSLDDIVREIEAEKRSAEDVA